MGWRGSNFTLPASSAPWMRPWDESRRALLSSRRSRSIGTPAGDLDEAVPCGHDHVPAVPVDEGARPVAVRLLPARGVPHVDVSGLDLGEGLIVPVASIADLIRMKRAAGRPKDLGHIAELVALEEEIDAMRLRGEDPRQG